MNSLIVGEVQLYCHEELSQRGRGWHLWTLLTALLQHGLEHGGPAVAGLGPAVAGWRGRKTMYAVLY